MSEPPAPGAWLRRIAQEVDLSEDDTAAPVDPELVDRFVAGELDEAQSRYVAHLAATYRSWSEAISTAYEDRFSKSTTSLVRDRAPTQWGFLLALAAMLLLAVGYWTTRRKDDGRQIARATPTPADPKTPGEERVEDDLFGEDPPALGGTSEDIYDDLFGPPATARPAALLEMERLAGEEGGPDGDRAAESMAPYRTAIDNIRPEFRWRADTGGLVRVFALDAADKDATVVVSAKGEGGVWRPEQPLERGLVYEWRLTESTTSGETTHPASGEARALFMILSKTQHERLDEALEHAPDSLARAEAYYQAGVLDEAERLWRDAHDGEIPTELARRLDEARGFATP